MLGLPKRYKSHKGLEPTKEQSANYVDKQTSGTKNIDAGTAAERLKGREAQIAKALKDSGA
jgi:hypothetical protein